MIGYCDVVFCSFPRNVSVEYFQTFFGCYFTLVSKVLKIFVHGSRDDETPKECEARHV